MPKSKQRNYFSLSLLLFLCACTWGCNTSSSTKAKGFRSPRTREEVWDASRRLMETERRHHERLDIKIGAIETQHLSKKERQRRVNAELDAANAELKRVRDSNYTIPYDMDLHNK